jgi:hypothetical protein
MSPIVSWLENVSKSLTYSFQMGRQIDHQIMFLEQPFSAAQLNLMIGVWDFPGSAFPCFLDVCTIPDSARALSALSNLWRPISLKVGSASAPIENRNRNRVKDY